MKPENMGGINGLTPSEMSLIKYELHPGHIRELSSKV